jgi:hypothetical protein
MAPRKETAAASQQDYVTQSQLDALLERLSILDTLQAKLESMEQLLKTSNAKVLSLETEIAAKEKIILELRGHPKQHQKPEFRQKRNQNSLREKPTAENK